MSGKDTHTLRISYKEDEGIFLEALKFSRFVHRGFATFLEKIDPKEISITKEALEILLKCPYRSGVQALEIWEARRLAWGSMILRYNVDPRRICCEPRAKPWLQQCDIVQPGVTEGEKHVG